MRPIHIHDLRTIPYASSVHDLLITICIRVEGFLAATALDVRTDALTLPEGCEPRLQARRLVEGRRLECGEGLGEVEEGVLCEAWLRNPMVCNVRRGCRRNEHNGGLTCGPSMNAGGLA
jgi:hypothetical protein